MYEEKERRATMSMSNENKEYCQCKRITSITTEDDGEGFGYWDVCCTCGKHIEDGYHYYNHYDGEDHEDIDY